MTVSRSAAHDGMVASHPVDGTRSGDRLYLLDGSMFFDLIKVASLLEGVLVPACTTFHRNLEFGLSRVAD